MGSPARAWGARGGSGSHAWGASGPYGSAPPEAWSAPVEPGGPDEGPLGMISGKGKLDGSEPGGPTAAPSRAWGARGNGGSRAWGAREPHMAEPPETWWPAGVEGRDGHKLPRVPVPRAAARPDHPPRRRASLRSRYSAGRGRRRPRASTPQPAAGSPSGMTFSEDKPDGFEPGALTAALARAWGARGDGGPHAWGAGEPHGAPAPEAPWLRAGTGWVAPPGAESPGGVRADRSVEETRSRHLTPGGYGRARHGRGALQQWPRCSREVECGDGLGCRRFPPRATPPEARRSSG